MICVIWTAVTQVLQFCELRDVQKPSTISILTQRLLNFSSALLTFTYTRLTVNNLTRLFKQPLNTYLHKLIDQVVLHFPPFSFSTKIPRLANVPASEIIKTHTCSSLCQFNIIQHIFYYDCEETASVLMPLNNNQHNTTAG